MSTIIKTDDLRFSYAVTEGLAPIVLDGVDLEIEAGSFVAVLGHNGSGKSTLAKHMNAILLPTGGKVWVGGMDTADEARLLDIRRTVGMVFQNPDNQIVANVVEEDVAFAPENLGVPPAEIRQRVDAALKAVGMYEYREHAPHLLSGGPEAAGGHRRGHRHGAPLHRAGRAHRHAGPRWAAVRCCTPSRRSTGTSGVTVVLITHHMDEAALADRLVVMADGQDRGRRRPQDGLLPRGGAQGRGPDRPRDRRAAAHELRQDGLELPLDALSDRGVRPGPVPAFDLTAPAPQGQAPCIMLGLISFGTHHSDGKALACLQRRHALRAGRPGGRGLCRRSRGISGRHRPHRLGQVHPDSASQRPAKAHLGPGAVRGPGISGRPKSAPGPTRFQVGLVFQYPEYQLFEETVYQDIAFGPRNMGLDEAEIDRRVRSGRRLCGSARRSAGEVPL